jgi:hypothetical protein
MKKTIFSTIIIIYNFVHLINATVIKTNSNLKSDLKSTNISENIKVTGNTKSTSITPQYETVEIMHEMDAKGKKPEYVPKNEINDMKSATLLQKNDDYIQEPGMERPNFLSPVIHSVETSVYTPTNQANSDGLTYDLDSISNIIIKQN